jgi:hypothetical protein
MQKLGEKAQQEMKVGARIISVEHQINNWKPTYADPIDKIFMYQKV